MTGHEPADGMSGPGAGQGPTTEELWDLVVERSGAERVELLVDLSCRSAEGDIGTALALAEEAVGEARASLSDDQVINALLHHGRLLSGELRFHESAVVYLEAATLSSHGSDAVRTGHSHLLAGNSLALVEDIERAVEALRTSEAAFLCEEEWLGAGHAAQRAGRILWLQARPGEALEWLDRARPHFQHAGQADQVLDTDHLRASALRDLGRFDEAITVLTSCLAVSPTVRPQAKGSLEHFRLGRIYRTTGDFALAKDHLTRAHLHAVTHSNVHDAAHCLRELAMCQFFGQPADEAEALALLGQARAHYDLAGCGDCIIECDEEQAEWLVILDRFDEAAAINRRLIQGDDAPAAAHARLRLVDNLLRLARFEEACAELPEEEDPDRLRPDPVRELQLRASVLLGLGRTDEALVCADHGLALVDEATDPDVRAPLLEVRSQLSNDGSSVNDRAQAIAYYLAAGELDSARRLSQSFVPTPRPEPADLTLGHDPHPLPVTPAPAAETGPVETGSVESGTAGEA